MSRHRRVSLSGPTLGHAERAALGACLEGGWVSPAGPAVAAFEARSAATVGAAHAIATATGKAALRLALEACGAGAGRDVLVTDLGSVAAVDAVRSLGATPVLVDAEAGTWNIDPDRVVDELADRHRRNRPQPAAIVVTHLLSHPADLADLVEAASGWAVPVIEDAAEVLGARYLDGAVAGRLAGTVGTLGCFSFEADKIITTAGGGLVVTDDAGLAASVRGRADGSQRLAGSRVDDGGADVRMSGLNAALGTAQIGRLGDLVAARRRVAEAYDRAFTGVPGVRAQPARPWAARSGWQSAVVLPSAPHRDATMSALAAAGIASRPLWTPLHRLEPYRSCRRLGGRVADELAARVLCLPSGPELSEDDQDRVVSGVLGALTAARAA